MIIYINWDVNPEIFRLGGFALRYYSLFFALAFMLVMPSWQESIKRKIYPLCI